MLRVGSRNVCNIEELYPYRTTKYGVNMSIEKFGIIQGVRRILDVAKSRTNAAIIYQVFWVNLISANSSCCAVWGPIANQKISRLMV